MNQNIESFREYMEEYHPDLPHVRTYKEVCSTCRGEGRSTAYLGDVTDLMREDYEFAEDYLGGFYDRGCPTCDGVRVVDVVDIDRTDPRTVKEWGEWMDAYYETEAIYAAERAMGA